MTDRVTKAANEVKLIAFACEAGMGSSLMGANQLKKMIKKAELDIKVIHTPVQQIPEETDVVLTHAKLAQGASDKAPWAAIVSYKLFMNDPAVKSLVASLSAGESITSEF